MSNLKTHSADLSDSASSISDRSEGGGGVAAIVACLLVFVILGGGGAVGFVVYLGYRAQLAEEQQRAIAVAEMAQVQAAIAAQRAEQMAAVAANAKAAQVAAEQLPAAAPPDAVIAPPAASPEERFQAEIEPLTAATEERPDDPQVWQARARIFQRWQKWQEAAEDYERFLEINPQSVWIRLDAAATRFANGDREAYLAHCKFAEQRLATKTQPTNEHNRAARVLCLAPGALTSGETLLVTAQNEPLKNPGKWWLLEPMLALQYRTGRYEDAAKMIDEVRPLAGFNGQKAATEIWAAMTYHQLGRAEEARQALAAAERYVAEGLPPPGTTNAGGDAVIIALYMLDEAKALVEGPAAPASNEED